MNRGSDEIGLKVRARALGLLILALAAGALLALEISDSEAGGHVGQYVTVRGKVANVYTSDKGNTFLNFGARYPNHRFAGVVFSKSKSIFGDLHALEGREIGVTGTVKMYNGKPEIIVERREQLTVSTD